jgi:hypothetical protein
VLVEVDDVADFPGDLFPVVFGEELAGGLPAPADPRPLRPRR